jgi:hypothetical protein
VGSRVGVGAVAKRKILCHCRVSNPGRPACSLVTILSELNWLQQFGSTCIEGYTYLLKVFVRYLIVFAFSIHNIIVLFTSSFFLSVDGNPVI